MKIKNLLLVLLGICLLVACTGTAAKPAAPTSTIIPSTSTPIAIPLPSTSMVPPSPLAPIYEKVDVGGYALQIQCIGQGTPTVIIEAAFEAAPVRSGTWLAVTSEIRKTARICVYDRAGLGLSDTALGLTRTSKDIAQDLHTLLVNAKVQKPYILVGHSLGGFHVRLFASLYPDEVGGIVLVDSSHPDQWSEVSAVLPAESPDEPASIKELRTIPDINNLEKLDILASADQVRATGALGNLPLVVLSHSPTSAWSANLNLSPDVAEKVEKVWQKLQNELAGLSSSSTHIVAAKAGHFIQLDEPRLVIDAILKVIEEAKKRGQ